MIFGIVIPLKSKQISRDWAVTSAALERTVQSILGQTKDNFVAVIAGHDKPDFLDSLNDERIIFTKVSFDAPDRSAPNFTNQLLINDKVLKIMAGLVALKNYSLSWVYQLDSDDLMRRDFIETIENKTKSSAFIIEGGYVYYEKYNRIVETDEMDTLCGSIAVIDPSTFTFPETPDLKYINDIPWTKYRHMNIHKFYSEVTTGTVTRLNENLVSYILASGDNFSDRWREGIVAKLKASLKPYIFGKRPATSFKAQFSLLDK